MLRRQIHTNLKYILLWFTSYEVPWQTEQRSFIQNNCLNYNCFITYNKYLFGGDMTKFDAIIFDARGLPRKPELPKVRLPKQKYIFFTLESASYFPICGKIYDSFFNWTLTYKLDSDIVYPYFEIKNKMGEVIGPKRDMEWISKMEEVDEHLDKRLRNKTKVAAWFASRCSTKNLRETFVRKLDRHLNKYDLTVDVYGKCGPLQCGREKWHECKAMLENDYYFYMALENSFNEDYVTEKVLTAMQNYVVPIVYGGANYSSFLPPGSYIDGRAHSPSDLADVMYNLTQSPMEYRQYFKWKNYYTYGKDNPCLLCDAMNDDTKFGTKSVQKRIRYWWNIRPTCEYRTRRKERRRGRG